MNAIAIGTSLAGAVIAASTTDETLKIIASGVTGAGITVLVAPQLMRGQSGEAKSVVAPVAPQVKAGTYDERTDHATQALEVPVDYVTDQQSRRLRILERNNA